PRSTPFPYTTLFRSPAPRALAVQVTLADGSPLPAAGELNFADLALQPATGTLQLRAQLKNPQHVLLPGQFVRVRLLGLKRPSAIDRKSTRLNSSHSQ